MIMMMMMMIMMMIAGNMIRLTSSETFSETETLCAVVDTETAQERELLSKTCFSEFPFLCSLGECSVRHVSLVILSLQSR